MIQISKCKEWHGMRARIENVPIVTFTSDDYTAAAAQTTFSVPDVTAKDVRSFKTVKDIAVPADQTEYASAIVPLIRDDGRECAFVLYIYEDAERDPSIFTMLLQLVVVSATGTLSRSQLKHYTPLDAADLTKVILFYSVTYDGYTDRPMFPYSKAGTFVSKEDPVYASDTIGLMPGSTNPGALIRIEGYTAIAASIFSNLKIAILNDSYEFE